MVRVMTFIGALMGLGAPSLHAQYFEEYLRLSSYVDSLTIATDRIEGKVELPPNVKLFKVPVVRIPKLYGLTKTLGYASSPLVKKDDFDVLYVRTFSPPELSAVWSAEKLGGIPTILLLGGTWLFGSPESKPKGKERIYRWFLRRALRAARKIVLYSRLMLDELLKYDAKLDVLKVTYVHNAIDVSRFSPELDAPESLRGALGDAKRYVIYVGRLNEKKGIEDLLRAFALLRKKFEDVALVVIGSGEHSYVQRLNELAAKLEVSSSVHILGPVPNAEIPRYLAGASLLVYPSRGGEGIPRAILEAMACGVPVVATRIAGIPEAVKEGENGYLVAPMDIEAIADSVERILSDDVLRKNMSLRARRIAEDEFSYDVVIPKLVKLFEEVAKR